MANEKKPSIYSDRGTIGSSSELDEYGVWVKSEAQDLTLNNNADVGSFDDMDLPNLGDLPDLDDLKAEIPDINLADDDFSIPDIESSMEEDSDLIHFEDFTASGETEEISDETSGDKDDGDYTYVSLEDFIGVSVPPSQNDSEEESSDVDTDFELPNEDEIIFPSDPEPDSAATQTQSSDLSTKLLMKIADELATIRLELSSLKKDFTPSKTSSTVKSEQEESGFLDEEDDEKISLTGDELNNILITADFTEETGSDAALEIGSDPSEELSEDQPEDFSIQEQEIISEEIDLSSELEETESMDIAEETEYLASDPVLDSSDFSVESEEINLTEDIDISMDSPDIDEDIIDFSEAVIDEPDISSEIQDTPLEEPVLDDISLSMDLSELDTLESPNESTEEPELLPEEASPLDETDMEDPIEMLLEETDESAELSLSDESSEELILEELSIDDTVTEELQGLEDIMELEETDSFEALSEDADSIEPLLDDTESLEPILEESVEMVLESSAEPEQWAGEESLLEESSLDELSLDEATLEETALEDIEPLVGIEDSLESIEDSIELSAEPEQLSEEAAPIEDLESLEPSLPDEDLDFLEADEALEELPEEIEDLPEELEDLPAELDGLPDELNEIAVKESTSEVSESIPSPLKEELRTVLSYMDQLLEALPDEKIEEFARSEHYDTYKKLFKELGLV